MKYYFTATLFNSPPSGDSGLKSKIKPRWIFPRTLRYQFFQFCNRSLKPEMQLFFFLGSLQYDTNYIGLIFHIIYWIWPRIMFSNAVNRMSGGKKTVVGFPSKTKRWISLFKHQQKKACFSPSEVFWWLLSHLVDVFHLFHLFHVLHVFQTYSIFSHPGWQDSTNSAALQVPNDKCSDALIFICSEDQIFKCLNVQMFKWLNI